MDTKLFSAFGHGVLRRTCTKGEVLNDEDYANGLIEIVEPWPTSWIVTSGLIHQENVATGQVSVRRPGYNTIDSPETTGTWRCVFVEDATVFCVPDPANRGLRNALKPFILPRGQRVNLPAGTKLSLFQGVLSVGGNTIRDLRQVSVVTGDKEAVANEDCYGFVFP